MTTADRTRLAARTPGTADAPQVVVPQWADQPYWADRVVGLGIGTAHLAAADGAVQDALVEDAPELGRTRSVKIACRAKRAATCSSRSSRLPSGRADRIARAYSSVCSRPGTTSGSYQRRIVAWASMSAHCWNQRYRRCLWPFFR